MFRLFEKRPPASLWRDVDQAPAEVVLIVACKARAQSGAVGPIYYAPQARIAWRDSAGAWTDFATGFPLDIEPELFIELPPLVDGRPALNVTPRRRPGKAGVAWG